MAKFRPDWKLHAARAVAYGVAAFLVTWLLYLISFSGDSSAWRLSVVDCAVLAAVFFAVYMGRDVWEWARERRRSGPE